MKRTSVSLEDQQFEKLKGVAALRDQSLARLVREAVDEWLSSRGVTLIDADERRRRINRLLNRDEESTGTPVLTEDERMRRFDGLLKRRAEIAREYGSWDPAEVERDIEEAIKEVREARAARRL